MSRVKVQKYSAIGCKEYDGCYANNDQTCNHRWEDAASLKIAKKE
jgi:hypothetical protein